MIGLGLDLCEISRIEKVLAAGDAFLQRYYTPAEREYLASRGRVRAQSAAAMYAAKEALLKAFGVGLSGGISLCDIGVAHDASGAPSYVLTGAAQEKMRQLKASRALLTLTHDGGMAAAVAIIE